MSDQHRALLLALMGDDPEHQRRWHRSAHFRVGVETLARWLPHLVESIAADAAIAEEAAARLVEVEKRMALPRIMLDNGPNGMRIGITDDEDARRRAAAEALGEDVDDLTARARPAWLATNEDVPQLWEE